MLCHAAFDEALLNVSCVIWPTICVPAASYAPSHAVFDEALLMIYIRREARCDGR